MTDDALNLDATSQAQLVQTGEVTAAELVEAAIARIEKLNGELNAVIHERFERARGEAEAIRPGTDQLFAGVPFVHKDLDGQTAGDPYHAGSRFLKDHGYIAVHDSYIAAKFKASGMVLVGKTNTPELGLVPSTEPESYGPTRNPWNTEHSPGGSSGGSGAAVASGMVAVGHAGDAGGSIRIPASECGLVGLKPSRGRVSLGPDEGEGWDGLGTRGVVTRSVRDTAAILDVTAGPMPGDPYFAPPPARPFADEVGADPGSLRIGVCATVPNGATTVDPECVDAVERTGQLLESLGHQVEPGYPQALEEDATNDLLILFPSIVAREVDRLTEMVGRSPSEADVESGTWITAEMGRGIGSAQYLGAKQRLQAWTRRVAEWWETYDVLLTPTLTTPPPPLGSFTATPENPMEGSLRAVALVAFTMPFNITGQPAVSLPLHWTTAGLPVGCQLVGRYGREDILLRVAAQLEQAQPWADRRPPVSA